ncbi:glycosyltransferase [Glutamicibacter sp. BW77]|uniref:glycosyltransferase n=1 Tax=Glutamicibacter TaxID=1742989 RepID=UPI001482E572|nr:glycosyltransferase [Glutamicibacter sp. BW77]
MREGLFGSLLAVSASTWRKSSQVQVVSYALENLDPFTRPAPRIRSKLRARLDFSLAKRLSRSLDRLCFGTSGSKKLYHELMPFAVTTQQTLIEALPASCVCPTEPVNGEPRIIFIGDFSVRKGVDAILNAWPLVAAQIPDAKLTIIGKGTLAPEVRELAEKDPRVSVFYDPPRRTIHQQLRRAHALVLPSRRTPRWREQVGLPIVEGLAHGCRIISSDETGLAPWLKCHDHLVVPHESIDTELPTALIIALREAQSWTPATIDLPSIDGRLAADIWMHQGA